MTQIHKVKKKKNEDTQGDCRMKTGDWENEIKPRNDKDFKQTTRS